MMKLSRGAWIAMAAVAAVPVTVAFAKQGDFRGWHGMSPETRSRLDEGKIAMAKAALKLSAEQEKLWAPLEAQARDFMKVRQDKMAERKKEREERRAERKADGAEKKRPDMAERLAKMSQNMSERAERVKAFSTAFTPFYASLSEEQKEVLRPLMRDLSPGFGKGGPKGPRWAHGGWGHGGRDGHGGWGGRHERGERGGPITDDAGPGGPDAGDDAGATPAEPAAKQ